MIRHTIFTPVYNRKTELFFLASHIGKLNYPKNEFEWLIIDDGSTDGLDSEINLLIPKYSDLIIRYVRKQNGGIHTAQNEAVRLAKGKYITRIDSDDYLLPNALLIKDKALMGYEDDPKIAGVVGLCLNAKDMSVRGVPFPDHVSITKGYILRNRYNVYGDRNFCIKIGVMREFLIPEYDDTNWVPEGATLWLDVDKNYDTIFINEPMSVCMEPNENSVTGQLKQESRANVMSGYYGNLFIVNNGCGYYTSTQWLKAICVMGIKMLQAKKYNPNKYGVMRGFSDLSHIHSKFLYACMMPVWVIYYLLFKK